jgi:hypothetical protein
MKSKSPEEFAAAVTELKKYPAVIRNLFNSPAPTGDHLRRNAKAAGLTKPAKPGAK